MSLPPPSKKNTSGYAIQIAVDREFSADPINKGTETTSNSNANRRADRKITQRFPTNALEITDSSTDQLSDIPRRRAPTLSSSVGRETRKLKISSRTPLHTDLTSYNITEESYNRSRDEIGYNSTQIIMKTLQDEPLLVLSKEMLTQRNFSKPFSSFKMIMNAERQKDKKLDDDLTELRTTRNLITKQLMMNKKGEKVYEKCIQEVERDSFRRVYNEITKQQYRERLMPRVKKYPSMNLGGSMYFDPKVDVSVQPARTELDNVKAIFEKQVSVFIHKGPEIFSERPDVREGAAMVTVGKYAYVYGGMFHSLINTIDVLDTSRWFWTKVNAKGDVPSEGRYGHTVCYYRHTLVVFGGEKQYNPALRTRECLNDVKTFSIDTKEWKNIRCFGDIIEPRRNHVAAIVGKSMIVYGGVSSSGLYLSDLISLNFNDLKWSACNVATSDYVGIAFHACCLVVHPDRRDIQLYKGMEGAASERQPTIKEEGLYFFGGKNEFGEILNTLRILKIGQRPLKWVTPETKGKPPAPRCQHILVHYPGLNALVVHGGRNDKAANSGVAEGSFNDVAILHLETLQWMTVITHGTERTARFSHCARMFGTKLIIFGGMNFSSYMDSAVEIAEFDQKSINRLLEEEQLKIAKQKNLSQLPAVMDSVFPRKQVQQTTISFPKLSMEKLNLYLPIPSKEQLRKQSGDPQRENIEEKSPKKLQIHEVFKTTIKKLILNRNPVRTRTLAPLKLERTSINEPKTNGESNQLADAGDGN